MLTQLHVHRISIVMLAPHDMLEELKKPLFSGCEQHFAPSLSMHLINVKSGWNIFAHAMDEILCVMDECTPSDATF